MSAVNSISRTQTLVRVIIASALASTVGITWPLWQAREYPPVLPLLPLPQINCGPILLCACGAMAALPRAGTAICYACFAWAIAADQIRLQPEIPSLLLLSLSTLGRPESDIVARASLVSLWGFAGLHKLLSPAFFSSVGPWLLGEWGSGEVGWIIGGTIAISEVLLALASLWPTTRRIAALCAISFHGSILVALSPLGINWNSAVWPWNAALVAVAPAILLQWQGRGLGYEWRQAAAWGKAWAAGLLVMPVGYWFGVVDANLAACVYAYNTPTAFVCTETSETDVNTYCESLNVPLPPAHRLYGPFFLGVGSLGERLEIHDARLVARVFGFKQRTITWESLIPSNADFVAPVVAPVAD